MTEGDYLWCLLNMELDAEESLGQLCPACRQEALEGRCPACGAPAGTVEGEENAAFDPLRFRQMKEGTT